MMMTDFATAHPAEEAFRIVRVRLRLIAEAVGFLIIDAMQVNRPANSFQEPASSAYSSVCGARSRGGTAPRRYYR